MCLIVGLLYGYRALTMIVTVLPAANPDYLCDPQVMMLMMMMVKIIAVLATKRYCHQPYSDDIGFQSISMTTTQKNI